MHRAVGEGRRRLGVVVMPVAVRQTEVIETQSRPSMQATKKRSATSVASSSSRQAPKNRDLIA